MYILNMYTRARPTIQIILVIYVIPEIINVCMKL